MHLKFSTDSVGSLSMNGVQSRTCALVSLFPVGLKMFYLVLLIVLKMRVHLGKVKRILGFWTRCSILYFLRYVQDSRR